MTRPDWDAVWMHMADAIGPRSKCSRARVGVVIVSRDNRVISVGYNGPPRDMEANGDCTNWCPRAMGLEPPDALYDDCPAAHAETNAIARADYSEMQGATVYVTSSMCKGCAKVVANSGVRRVVQRVDPDQAFRSPERTEHFLRMCGLAVERWDDESATTR